MLRGHRPIALAALTIGLTAPAAASATASATPQDVAATHAYIVANAALASASLARVHSTQARIVQFRRRLDRECPNAGAGSPQSEEGHRLSYEVAGALWSVSYGADAGPIHTFATAVRGLRWSNAKLTRVAAGYAKSLLALAALPLPSICADVRAWRAGDFQTAPATTQAFDRRAEAAEGHSISPRLLAPYVQPADRGTLAATTRLESKLEGNELSAGMNDWDELLAVLGLQQ